MTKLTEKLQNADKQDDDVQMWQARFETWWRAQPCDDGSHDLGHFRRVYLMALRIAKLENVSYDPMVLLAAAYFHDLVNVPKDSPDRNRASTFSAEKTPEILTEMGFPSEKFDAICHAIAAHSFSANIPAETVEAKMIQDADRMESIGAMGVARNMYVSGKMNTSLFHPDDPMGESARKKDDSLYALDHFDLKLLKLPSMMQTDAGRKIAEERAAFLVAFRERMVQEILGEI